MEVLRKREKRYGLLFNSGNDAIFVHGIGDGGPGKLTEVNDVACIRLGYSREELLEMSPVDIDAGGMDETRRRALEILAETGQCVFESVHASKSGDKIPVEISSRMFESEGERHVLSIARDITERKRVEAALRESEERYRQIFDIAPAGIWEVDFRTGKFVTVNNAVCEYSGYTKDELLSMNAIDVLTEESQEILLNRTGKVLSGESVPDTVDYEIIRKDGSLAWFSINNRYLYEGENIVGATVVARDITERKRVEEELKNKAQNLEEVNSALNVLIKNMESQESDIQEQVIANIKHLVLPYLTKIRNNTAESNRKSLLDIVESNLNKITANFSHQLSSSLYSLTSSEIKVANLVRLGSTTKEIANTLHISYKTVESHRENIRKKFGINKKKINLRSHLLSIK